MVYPFVHIMSRSLKQEMNELSCIVMQQTGESESHMTLRLNEPALNFDSPQTLLVTLVKLTHHCHIIFVWHNTHTGRRLIVNRHDVSKIK